MGWDAMECVVGKMVGGTEGREGMEDSEGNGREGMEGGGYEVEGREGRE